MKLRILILLLFPLILHSQIYYSINITNTTVDNVSWITAGTSIGYVDSWYEFGLYGELGYNTEFDYETGDVEWGIKGGEFARIFTPKYKLKAYLEAENFLIGLSKAGGGIRYQVNNLVFYIERKYAVFKKVQDKRFTETGLRIRF